MFTPNQIEQLRGIIDLQHIVFIATQISPDMLSDYEIQILKEAGVDIADIAATPFDDMFRWGMLSMGIGNQKARNMNYQQFERFIRSGNYLPLTPVEKEAKRVAQRQAASDLRGLGNRIVQETGQVLIEADQEQRAIYEQIITNETTANIQRRGSISKLVSNLGHKTGDWARDFGRISDYVMTQAFEEGRAAQIKSQHGGDRKVYKKVFQSACKKCVKLYLTDGFGSEPRLFKLSEIQANGTNIGRKVDEWKPVVGPTHPWCRCMLVDVDPNYTWNQEQQDYNTPVVTERRVQRQSRVTVKIGNTTTTV